MKTTVVPAQITTVEDKIAGNLSVIQLFLLTLPVFMGGAIFALWPPAIKVTVFKVALSVLIALISMSLAIRIKGKILLTWLVLLTHYGMRPRYYVFNKNDVYLRGSEAFEEEEVIVTKPVRKRRTAKDHTPLVPIPELVRIEEALADMRSNFYVKTNRRGKFDVRITEIK